MIIDKNYDVNVFTLPRDNGDAYKHVKEDKWDLSKSVFKDYRPDTHQLLMDCFDYDWKISKIAKFVKEPA